MGHVIHAILEKYPEDGAIAEERLGAEVKVGNKIVYLHGQADVYQPKSGRLDDYKLTSAMSMLYGDKVEHEAQLNLLAWIWRKNGRAVSSLRNIYLFRDWRAAEVKEGSNYPTEQVKVVEVAVWSDERCEAYAKERSTAHWRAANTKDDDLPKCTDDERWVRPPLHKVIKLDPKTGEPQKVSKFRSEQLGEAQSWIKDNNPDEKGRTFEYIIRTIPGKAVRCEFCEIRDFCSQHLAERALSTEED